MTSLGFVLRMAAREVRASPRRLLLLTASVAVGVAALVAINSFTANLRDSVRRQAQALLGADLSLESRQPLPAVAERLVARPGCRAYGPLSVLAAETYDVEALFDLDYHTKQVEVIFRRVFGKA